MFHATTLSFTCRLLMYSVESVSVRAGNRVWTWRFTDCIRLGKRAQNLRNARKTSGHTRLVVERSLLLFIEPKLPRQ